MRRRGNDERTFETTLKVRFTMTYAGGTADEVQAEAEEWADTIAEDVETGYASMYGVHTAEVVGTKLVRERGVRR